ncbi:MAG: lysophospholipid acyltransferase family protein [Oligoflexus sp.]|nr:lysophospholipid acyltransferase family protein [Oligoflexus sp.]
MKSALIKGCLHLVATFIRLLPKASVPWFAFLFSVLAPRLLKRDRTLIAENIDRVYHLPAQSSFSTMFQRQVFRSQALVALETFKHQLASRDLITLVGLDELRAEIERVTASGKGMIVVTAHHGSWELVASTVALASGKTFVALAKPSKLPEFTQVLDRLRRSGNTEILWTDSKNLLRDMMKTLKQGGNLGFVMDQKPEGRIGPVVEFLGQATEFVSGPAKLAARHQSAVVAIFCMRTGPWEYRIVFETVAEAAHAISDELVLTQKMATAITKAIQLYPEQWVWNYKRWRKKKLKTEIPMAKAAELNWKVPF